MSYAARNISNKLHWMTRQLRWKNQASEIQEWVSVMQSLNELLVSVLNNNDLVVNTVTHKSWRSRTFPVGRSTSVQGKVKDKGSSTNTKNEKVPLKVHNRKVVKGKRLLPRRGAKMNNITELGNESEKWILN